MGLWITRYIMFGKQKSLNTKYLSKRVTEWRTSRWEAAWLKSRKVVAFSLLVSLWSVSDLREGLGTWDGAGKVVGQRAQMEKLLTPLPFLGTLHCFLSMVGNFLTPFLEAKSITLGGDCGHCLASLNWRESTTHEEVFIQHLPPVLSYFCKKQLGSKEWPLPGYCQINAHTVSNAVSPESHPSGWQSLAELPKKRTKTSAVYWPPRAKLCLSQSQAWPGHPGVTQEAQLFCGSHLATVPPLVLSTEFSYY